MGDGRAEEATARITAYQVIESLTAAGAACSRPAMSGARADDGDSPPPV
jgi:hypothetical protein